MTQEEKKTFEYAAVSLLDVPYCIDNVFDYFIPLELRGEVYPGRFVTVPFGRGNRKQMAIVRSLSHCPSYNDVKPVDAVCSDRPEISEEMLSLCDFMKEQWLCTFGEAVRCVVPPSALGKMSEIYYPTQASGPNSSGGFGAADLFVYDYLCSTGGKSLDALKVRFGASAAESAVAKLLAKGFVKRELTVGKTMSDAFESFCALAISDEECRAILDGNGRIKLRSEKHKEIVKALIEGELPSKYICDSLGATQAQIRALEEKGLVRIEKRRVWRQSFDNESGEKTEYKLNGEQSEAFETIKAKLGSGRPEAVLLHGVTGSGKTSVITKMIDEAISQNKGVIVLVPEISLTPQTVDVFCGYYGDRVAVIHSNLSNGERFDTYKKISR